MKASYKIPTNLDVSYLDTEVALQTNGGVGLRPLPLKVILVWIAAVFGSFIMCFTQALPFHYLNPLFKVLFMGSVLAFVFLVTTTDKGGQSRFKALRYMATYMFNKSTRVLKTRRTDNPTAFYRMVGVKDIDENTGLITFLDGTCGFMYRVVGNASALLFDSDKAAIIDRVDNFYRKMPEYIRIEYITVKEPQKVIRQKMNFKKLFRERDNNDKDIQKIMQDSYDVLDKFVGSEFKSIHQYLLLVAGSKEYAAKAHSILSNEVHNSSLMFNTVEALYKEDVEFVYHTIYAA